MVKQEGDEGEEHVRQREGKIDEEKADGDVSVCKDSGNRSGSESEGDSEDGVWEVVEEE